MSSKYAYVDSDSAYVRLNHAAAVTIGARCTPLPSWCDHIRQVSVGMVKAMWHSQFGMGNVALITQLQNSLAVCLSYYRFACSFCLFKIVLLHQRTIVLV